MPSLNVSRKPNAKGTSVNFSSRVEGEGEQISCLSDRNRCETSSAYAFSAYTRSNRRPRQCQDGRREQTRPARQASAAECVKKKVGSLQLELSSAIVLLVRTTSHRHRPTRHRPPRPNLLAAICKSGKIEFTSCKNMCRRSSSKNSKVFSCCFLSPSTRRLFAEDAEAKAEAKAYAADLKRREKEEKRAQKEKLNEIRERQKSQLRAKAKAERRRQLICDSSEFRAPTIGARLSIVSFCLVVELLLQGLRLFTTFAIVIGNVSSRRIVSCTFEPSRHSRLSSFQIHKTFMPSYLISNDQQISNPDVLIAFTWVADCRWPSAHEHRLAGCRHCSKWRSFGRFSSSTTTNSAACVAAWGRFISLRGSRRSRSSAASACL